MPEPADLVTGVLLRLYEESLRVKYLSAIFLFLGAARILSTLELNREVAPVLLAGLNSGSRFFIWNKLRKVLHQKNSNYVRRYELFILLIMSSFGLLFQGNSTSQFI